MTNPTREDIIASMQAAAERMGLDLEDLQEMIDDVLTDCSIKAQRLQAAANEQDSDTIRKIAHDIKGSTANYGLTTASQLALQIEKERDSFPTVRIEELQSLLSRLSGLNLSGNKA
jgi:HPt (histidine-containing phosphotransfer) domain-containing protein